MTSFFKGLIVLLIAIHAWPTWLLSTMFVMAIALAQPFLSQRAGAQAQGGVPQQPREYLDLTVNIEAPIQPIPVKATDGKWYLVYHLFLTNWSFADVTLKSVEVSHGENAKTLARYEDKELSDFYRFRSLIPTPPRSEVPNKMYPRQIASGRTGVLFFWLTVDAPTAIPLTLTHRLTFEANPLIKLLRDSSPDKSGDMVLDNFKVVVSNDKPIVIGAPLHGGSWRCSNGPAYNSVHQYLTIREGKVRNAQRFAIDFNKVDAAGNILPSPFPDEITNKMFSATALKFSPLPMVLSPLLKTASRRMCLKHRERLSRRRRSHGKQYPAIG